MQQILYISFIILLLIITILPIVVVLLIYRVPPKILNVKHLSNEINRINNNVQYCGKNWIRKNRNNNFEMYVEGDAYQIGYYAGLLTKKLFEYQEKLFINELKLKVPNVFFRFVLKIAIGIVNRKIDKHIGGEYCKEIFGISKSASRKFSYLAPAYLRILNYHAAHDIGHALQDKKYVGCTAFSVKNNLSENGDLLIGRNFDFYINDEFCKDKIVAFYNPSNGYKFAMVTWAGMIGVVSGMNINGITVTLNGAKSSIPKKSATPVSIVARKILQYSSNLKEAVEIANKHSIFVSELIMVSSAADKKSIIIEKTPFNTDVYDCNDNFVICTNHFQSNKLKNEKANIENINESSTMYRYNRVKQLIDEDNPINIKQIADILRNNKGIDNKDIGLGNEKTINQIIAHHSVIFIPEKLIMLVSSPPHNLGEYLAYDLHDVFNITQNNLLNDIDIVDYKIDADIFLINNNFEKYEEYKKTINLLKVKKIIKNEADIIKKLCELNPEYYLTYTTIGDYFYNIKNFNEAKEWYIKSLSKEFYHIIERQKVEEQIVACEK